MFPFEFVKCMRNYVNIYSSSTSPTIICDAEYRFFWGNKAAKKQIPYSEERINIRSLLGEVELDEVEKAFRSKGHYVVSDLIPFRGLQTTMYPIFDPYTDKLYAVILIFLDETTLSGYDIDCSSKTSDKISDNIRNILQSTFSASDTISLKADLLEADWIIPQLNIIGLNSYQLLRLANNITYYGKMQNQQAEMETIQFDISDWLGKIRSSVQIIAEALSIPVEFNIPQEAIYLPLDSEWFQLAFFNIVHNSLYYTRNGNRVEISAIEEKGCVKLVIEDKGRGISAKMLPCIFKPYVSSGEYEDVPGVGLGLSLAHRIINKHNGQLEVESAEGEGTKITITLPIERKFSAELPLNQTSFQRSMHDRFSPLYVGLTSAILSPYAEDNHITPQKEA